MAVRVAEPSNARPQPSEASYEFATQSQMTQISNSIVQPLARPENLETAGLNEIESMLVRQGIQATCGQYACRVTLKGMPDRRYRFGHQIYEAITSLRARHFQI